ncbi:MAG: ATP-binding protein [Candidatus Peribacteraceae bacterium]|nr:ATP-binding protein [Candidatus Peribacteraceae bacterium]
MKPTEPTHIETDWVVVTGAPSSGKTTTVQALSETLMRPVRAEIATMVIRRRIQLGRTLVEATADQHGLQQEIFLEGGRSEDGLPHDVPHILDRGWPDVIAYELLYSGGRAEQWLHQVANARRRYRQVFRLDRLPFEDNDVRVDGAVADQLHELYGYVYTRLGYEVVDVPVLPVADRAAFIAECLRA